jgi:hypothetical protein
MGSIQQLAEGQDEYERAESIKEVRELCDHVATKPNKLIEVIAII